MNTRVQQSRSSDHFVLFLVAALLGGAALFFLQWRVTPLLLFYIAAAPLALVLALLHPVIPVLLFAAFSYFRFQEAYPVLEPLYLILIAGALSLLGGSWHLFVARNIKPYWTRELTLLAIFFTLVTVGILFAYDRNASYENWKNTYIKIVLMVPFIAWLLRTTDNFNLLARINTVGGILIGLRAIYNKIYGISLVEGTRVAIGREPAPAIEDPYAILQAMAAGVRKGVLTDPNDLALILLFPLGFAAGLLLFRSNRLNTWLGAIGVPIILIAIIFTQSRGALLGILTVTGIFGLQLIRSKFVIGMIGAVSVVALFFAMGIGERSSGGLDDIYESGQLDESAAERLIAWEAGINMAVHRPLFGVGLGNFVDAYYDYTLTPTEKPKAPHSTWFQVIGESGFLGIAIFLPMVLATLFTAIRVNNIVRLSTAPPLMKGISLGLVAGLASFCVAGSFLSQSYTWPIYVLLALTVAMRRYADTLLPPPARRRRAVPAPMR